MGSPGLDEIGEGRVNQVRRGSRLGVRGRGEVLARRKERGRYLRVPGWVVPRPRGVVRARSMDGLRSRRLKEAYVVSGWECESVMDGVDGMAPR